MFETTKGALWESSQSLERFGALKFRDSSLTQRVAQIHRAATKEITELRTVRQDLLIKFGAVEVERNTPYGVVTMLDIPVADTDNTNDFRQAWKDELAKPVKLPRQPIMADELPAEFWGREEEKNDAGKITKTRLEPLMDVQDVGALAEWLIVLGEDPDCSKAAEESESEE